MGPTHIHTRARQGCPLSSAQVPKGSDTTLLQKLKEAHKANVFWGGAPKGSRTCFVVMHYAGGVSYDVTG